MTEAVRHRIAPVLAEAAVRDAYAERRLTSLVFRRADELHDMLDVRFRKSTLDDFFGARVFFDVRLQDRVEHGIAREALLVGLIRLELGRRRAFDHALRNRRR